MPQKSCYNSSSYHLLLFYGMIFMAKKKQPTVMDAGNLLDDLAGVATQKAPASSKKPDTFLPCDDALKQAVDEYTASAVIFKITESKKKADDAKLKPMALNAYAELWAKTGIKPENPVLASSHGSVCLQVKEIYKIGGVGSDNLNLGAVKNLFIENNFTPELAEEFTSCVSLQRNVTTKSFDSLLEGSNAEKEAAQALMQAIRANLTPAQLSLVLETKPTLVVDVEALHGKIAKHCTGNKDRLISVLALVSPQPALSQPTHDNALEVAKTRFAQASENLTAKPK